MGAGDIIRATLPLPEAYQAVFVENQFNQIVGTSTNEASKAAEQTLKKLQLALSDFRGQSVMLIVEKACSCQPVQNKNELVEAAFSLEVVRDERAFKEALDRFLALLKETIGAQKVRVVW
ncbi:hypothetical protein [Shimazuella kribbensis]|uniref:hypothetical protein n=1 Tax=Shimazuella kribbensis TaxID=139808 RepID=UPI00040F5E8D|nr:hypothetical protein [Shimazuella kribbensis]